MFAPSLPGHLGEVLFPRRVLEVCFWNFKTWFLEDKLHLSPDLSYDGTGKPLYLKMKIFCYRRSVSSRLSFHARLPNYLKTRFGIVTGMLARVSGPFIACLLQLMDHLNADDGSRL